MDEIHAAVLDVKLRHLDEDIPNYTYEQEMDYVKEHYPRYPNVSVDYAILEQSKDVYVMKCDSRQEQVLVQKRVDLAGAFAHHHHSLDVP